MCVRHLTYSKTDECVNMKLIVAYKKIVSCFYISSTD